MVMRNYLASVGFVTAQEEQESVNTLQAGIERPMYHLRCSQSVDRHMRLGSERLPKHGFMMMFSIFCSAR